MTGKQGKGGGAAPRKKPGPPKGSPRRGGRQKNTKNKATLERERAAQLEAERVALLEKAARTGLQADGTRALEQKLMKDVGMDATRLAAGLATFFAPWPTWSRDKKGKLVNENPNFDEAKFRYYLGITMQGSRDFAAYESPKLAAVLVQSDVVETITIEGGLPDEQDGSLSDAPEGGGQQFLGPETGDHTPWDEGEPGAAPGNHPTADVPSGTTEAVPAEGQAEGGPLRKAVG